jgi:hypothetical protein
MRTKNHQTQIEAHSDQTEESLPIPVEGQNFKDKILHIDSPN